MKWMGRVRHDIQYLHPGQRSLEVAVGRAGWLAGRSGQGLQAGGAELVVCRLFKAGWLSAD